MFPQYYVDCVSIDLYRVWLSNSGLNVSYS